MSAKTIVNVEFQTTIELPKPPNFLRTKDGRTIPVGELTMSQARDIGEELKKQFINHVDKKGGTHK